MLQNRKIRVTAQAQASVGSSSGYGTIFPILEHVLYLPKKHFPLLFNKYRKLKLKKYIFALRSNHDFFHKISSKIFLNEGKIKILKLFAHVQKVLL